MACARALCITYAMRSPLHGLGDVFAPKKSNNIL